MTSPDLKPETRKTDSEGRQPTVAVIGSGVAGSTCAARLSQRGFQVTVFDKGRKTGGRLASRNREQEEFDYGAQYFTARDPLFMKRLEQCIADESVMEWCGRFGVFKNDSFEIQEPHSTRYVAVPSMQTLSFSLLSGLDVHSSSTVTSVVRDQTTSQWTIEGLRSPFDDGAEENDHFRYGSFDFIVLNMPPPQAQVLFGHEQLPPAVMAPCWSVMVSFANPLPIIFDGATVQGSSLVWIARDSSKPGRPEGERWVMQASAEWSENHLEENEKVVSTSLLSDFFALTKSDPVAATFCRAHRWRYARATVPCSERYIYNADKNIGYCGDWCGGDRIESAYLSGFALAEKITDFSSPNKLWHNL
ncbi:MAG: FAD-dependent oxidoreductase [Candidatus Melainabacteria bacterium]|nr:FAD-dependent oxidoreductase [Candidatus Melainabacteria bacterium]